MMDSYQFIQCNQSYGHTYYTDRRDDEGMWSAEKRGWSTQDWIEKRGFELRLVRLATSISPLPEPAETYASILGV